MNRGGFHPGGPFSSNAIGVPVSRAKAEPYGMDFECNIPLSNGTDAF